LLENIPKKQKIKFILSKFSSKLFPKINGNNSIIIEDDDIKID
jgi:hypothetical protein